MKKCVAIAVGIAAAVFIAAVWKMPWPDAIDGGRSELYGGVQVLLVGVGLVAISMVGIGVTLVMSALARRRESSTAEGTIGARATVIATTT